MAKSLFRALVALSFLAPLWLNAAPRVITLSPANTELAFAAGITPVGVSSYSDYPPQAQKIEQVSTWQGMNLERIVALKPDLVIAWRGGNAERQVDQLASLGIKVMWVDATSIEQIANALRQLAPWSPQPDKAEQAAQSLLDQYAQDGAEYAAYHALYRALVTAKRALDALTSSEEEKQRRIAELSEEIDTIDAAALTAGEEERLMERRKVIMHAQGILDGLTAAHQALSGDDSGEMMGAADLLGSVVNELAESARLDESLAPLSERLSDLYYGARELATDLADRLDGYDFDPGELDQIEERLDQIYRMKQRYGASVEELLTRRDKAAEELEGYQSSGKRIAELTQLATVLALPDKNGDVLVRAGIIKTKVPLKGLKQPEKLVKDPKPQTKAQQRYSRLTGDANRPNGRVERVQRTAKMECNLLGLTVDEALPEVDSFIDRAILNGQTVVYLIHGNGTGALRTAIHKHLRGNRMVKSFRLGRYGEGESGVTVVELK